MFEALSRRESRRTLQAGEYFFDQPVTAFEVFDTLAEGRVYVRELVIPEGYSMFDIADLVAREGFTSREDFLAAARDPSAGSRSCAQAHRAWRVFSSRRPTGFPGIPRVGRWWTPWSNASGRSGPRFATETVPAPSPERHRCEETLTLASLVERETPKPDERPLVAGVFANRLQQSMPLQCDPTVVYALELAGQYSGTLEAQRASVRIALQYLSPPGLPPGPIANPGEASLRAALAPAKTDYLYFVANTEGGHFFSKTLAEHNRNVVEVSASCWRRSATRRASRTARAAAPAVRARVAP